MAEWTLTLTNLGAALCKWQTSKPSAKSSLKPVFRLIFLCHKRPPLLMISTKHVQEGVTRQTATITTRAKWTYKRWKTYWNFNIKISLLKVPPLEFWIYYYLSRVREPLSPHNNNLYDVNSSSHRSNSTHVYMHVWVHTTSVMWKDLKHTKEMVVVGGGESTALYVCLFLSFWATV